MEFYVVIPAYNEKRTIRNIVQSALKYTSQVIVIDDGSSDGTAEELHGLSITLLQHSENKGKAASLFEGITCAINKGAEAIVTLDGDGQHSPDDIPLLLGEAENHPKTIIIGARLADKDSIPKKRYYANKIANFWISWASGYQIDDSQSGFRLYPASLFDGLKISTTKLKSFVFESEILIKAAQRKIYSKPVKIPAIYSNNARPSHFRGVRDIALITRMVAFQLLKRGLYPQGLYRAWIKPMAHTSRFDQTGMDGYFVLLLSLLLIVVSFGLTLLITYSYIIYVAIKTSRALSGDANIYLLLGQKLVNNQPAADYKLRLNSAISLLEEHSTSEVLLLGGITGNSKISESEAGRNYLIAHNIDSGRILIEESSRNTLENLRQARQIFDLNNKNLCLISNRYHLARSQIIAKGFGIYALTYPAEATLRPLLTNLLKALPEAFHLHWYLTGKKYAQLTNNKKMLARIS